MQKLAPFLFLCATQLVYLGVEGTRQQSQGMHDTQEVRITFVLMSCNTSGRRVTIVFPIDNPG
eukprot:1009839-Amorphochlora_amoeboformis.AAC.2